MATKSSGLLRPSEAIGGGPVECGMDALATSHGLRFQGTAMHQPQGYPHVLYPPKRGELFLSTIPFLTKMTRNYAMPDSLTPESSFPETSVLKDIKLLKCGPEALITLSWVPPFVHPLLEDTRSSRGLST